MPWPPALGRHHADEIFGRLPRSGETTYGLAVGIYPVPDHPRLPPPADG